MFRDRTLFIIGAGAGQTGFKKEQSTSLIERYATKHRAVGFPLGYQLKKDIVTVLEAAPTDEPRTGYRGIVGNGKELLRRAFETEAGTKEVEEALNIVCDGLPFASSIDYFLEIRRDNELVPVIAKHAIAEVISHHEKYCAIPNALDETWHQEFLQMLFQGTGKEAIADALSRVTVVSFNYDRSIQCVVLMALQGLFSLNESEALKDFRVLYPYGSLGDLASVPYGNLPNIDQLSIKTFTEATDDKTRELVCSVVAQAEHMVFLGFGFHPQNMALLLEGVTDIRDREIIGTSLGMAPKSKTAAEDTIKRSLSLDGTIGRVTVEFEDVECRELLARHQYSLLDRNY